MLLLAIASKILFMTFTYIHIMLIHHNNNAFKNLLVEEDTSEIKD